MLLMVMFILSGGLAFVSLIFFFIGNELLKSISGDLKPPDPAGFGSEFRRRSLRNAILFRAVWYWIFTASLVTCWISYSVGMGNPNMATYGALGLLGAMACLWTLIPDYRKQHPG